MVLTSDFFIQNLPMVIDVSERIRVKQSELFIFSKRRRYAHTFGILPEKIRSATNSIFDDLKHVGASAFKINWFDIIDFT